MVRNTIQPIMMPSAEVGDFVGESATDLASRAVDSAGSHVLLFAMSVACLAFELW